MSRRRVTVLWAVALLVACAGIVAATSSEPPPEASMPTIDDPVVRLTPTDGPIMSPVVAPDRGTPEPASPDSSPCGAEALQIDVVPTKATFAAGETVRGMFFVQTGRARGCSVAMPASFRIENVATGKVLGTAPAVTEVPNPLAADGSMHTSTFAWEPRDCSGSTCTPLPPALYQAVAEWSGGSSYRGWGEFRIGA